MLYAANAGDARAVLCRGGEALRLTYDHKGSDAQESKRIMDAGGFVMNNRVNGGLYSLSISFQLIADDHSSLGVLAVTRSLGDSAMKDFVVGAPYTTETELGSADEFLIIACDGVCVSPLGSTDVVADCSLSFLSLESFSSHSFEQSALGRDRRSRGRQPRPRNARRAADGQVPPRSCYGQVFER